MPTANSRTNLDINVNTRSVPNDVNTVIGLGFIFKEYKGAAMKIVVYKSEASTDRWGGEAHYCPASYSALAVDGEGRMVRLFVHHAPGRAARRLVKAMDSIFSALASNGI